MSKTNKTEVTSSRIHKKDLAPQLIHLFERHPEELLDLKTIFRELKLKTHPAKMMCIDVLDELALDDYVVVRNHRYSLAVPATVMEGTFHRKTNGKNTFLPDDGGEPILVAERNSMHAMDNDRVKVQMMARRRGHVREATVIDIVKRADKAFVGQIDVMRDMAFVSIEDRTLNCDIFVPKTQLHGAKTGDKVVVRIIEWPENRKNPVGKVVDVLGKSGENDTEMHAILAEFGLPYTYPASVEEAANKLDATITEAELAGREDFRDVTTFTIDPYDAKDFDDALSFREIANSKSTSNKLYEVGVHIADVSHYVTEGSIIDREAVKRATSVYLVDRTIPMLPERLCNFICSLRPNEDKLCYSVVFHLNERAEVKHWHLAHTVIRSNRRFTYEEVQALLEERKEASPEDYRVTSNKILTPQEGNGGAPASEFDNELITLNRLAKQLRQRRMSAGAVDFDRTEVRFEIDEKGHPTGTYIKVAKDANKLIEEFMLLANRTVAESVGRVAKGQKPKVLPYRIHEQPDQEKLINLSQFVAKFGHKLRTTGAPLDISKSINNLLHEVHGQKEQNVVEMVALRAMMKARYSTNNIGHYGLAFDYYTHFTSPIRRYPDLMVHRLLTRYAEGGRSASQDKYEQLCDHSSAMEQTAALAERASIKYKQVEFMADRLGQEFDGIISGLTESGIFVELNETKCEGMVSMRDLNDDYYEFDERNYRLIGRRHHYCYALGDSIRIKVARANLDRKQLDFIIVRKGTERK
ncbi:MAG: ribonuclease R [Bacteroidaceae bacterium]|nr:ribonuclease R [Bacteroidaceae bacterium]